MAKKRKGYNWKARDGGDQQEVAENPNADILTKKIAKLEKGSSAVQKRRLTPKQKKKLEKLVEEKEKKAKRSSLLESLAAQQVGAHELQLLHSTSKLGQPQSATALSAQVLEQSSETITSQGRKRKRQKAPGRRRKAKPSVQLGSSSDSDSDDSSSEEEEEEADAVSDGDSDVSASTDEEMEQADDSPEADADAASDLISRSDAPAPVDAPSSAPPTPALPTPVAAKPVVHVALNRDPALQAARLELPILAEEQVIMEAIHENAIVIIAGETGSGKTTQLPQFLYEAGYTKSKTGKPLRIGVTEPRRVAAVSMAKRVGEEMGLTEKEVSYQIRYAGTATDDTEIKFMTDGVLLKEIENDFLLGNYSVVIVDEAHERSIYTDILLGLLSRIVPLRTKRGNPLKLIIMSATLRVEDFTENRHLFPTPPPVIEVSSRQHPVTVHFSKRTPNDDQYMHEAAKKVCKIHRQLPEGGILVFVTGQQEVSWLCSKLKRTFPATTKAEPSSADGRESRPALRKINLDDVPSEPTFDGHDVDGDMGDEDIVENSDDSDSDGSGDDDVQMDTTAHDQHLPMKVLPLYALLPPERQAEVFAPPPDGVRLCVVATNVAETSLTIPNMKYIVDTGKVKRRYYDKVTGVSTFRVGWTSAASADQRAGRAGRTGPGHTYRLFSSAVFGNEFEKFSPPEITRRPVDDLYLQLKNLHIVKVENFPFPTPPPTDSIKAAEKLLLSLGALEVKKLKNGKGFATEITAVGRSMSNYPVSPRFSKMLTMRNQHGLLPYAIAMVAVLSVQDILAMPSFGSKDEEEDKDVEKSRDMFAKALVSKWGSKNSTGLLGDVLLLLKAVFAAEAAGCTQEFCQENGIRRKAVIEVRKLRKQLSSAINVKFSSDIAVLDPNMQPPSAKQVVLLRQLILCGLCDHTARKIDTSDMPMADKRRLRYAYQCNIMEEPVYMHSSCALKYQKAFPEFVVFREVIETTKPFMQCVVAVEDAWLPRYAAQYCELSEPLEIPPPEFDQPSGTVKCHRTVTFGPASWPVPAQPLAFPDGPQKFLWFARFLLDGVVVSKLAKFSGSLLFKPSTILRPWGYKCHAWIKDIVDTLVVAKVSDRAALIRTWKTNPKFLLNEYKAWLPQAQHPSLCLEWPPLS